MAILEVARALGPDGRGASAFLLVTAQVVATLAAFGLPEATIVLAADPLRRPRLLTNLILFGIFSAGVAALATTAGLSALGDLRPSAAGPRELPALGAAIIAYALSNAGGSFLLGSGRFLQRAAITAFFPWLYAGTIAGLSFSLGLDVTMVVLAWAGCQALAGVVSILFAMRGVGLGRPGGSLLRSSLGVGVRLWIGSLASFLNFRVDQVLMGFISTQRTLGVYAVAVNLSEPLLYFPSAVSTALIPLVAGSSPENRLGLTLRALRFLLVGTLGSILVAALVGPPILPPLFGSEFVTSVEPYLWLLPGAIGYVFIRVFSSALMGASSPGLSSVGSVTALGVGVALDFALIPSLGATGAAIAATAAFAAGGITALLVFRRHTRFAWRLVLNRTGSD